MMAGVGRVAATIVASLACGTAVTAAASGETGATEQIAALAWARRASASLDAPRSLRGLMTSGRVIALGEATHGAQEFLTLRNQLVRTGVERHGITAIAAETGFAQSIAIDDYIAGKGTFTTALVRDVFTFRAPDAMQANLELLEWLRAHNARAGVKRKVRFYGIEMMGRHHKGAQLYARPVFDAATAYATDRGEPQALALSASLEPLLKKLTTAGYAAFDQSEKDRQTLAIADLVRLFERRRIEWSDATSAKAFERAFRNARNAQNLDADLRASGWWGSRGSDRNQHDASSAESVQWILDQEGADGRIFLFAHNLHIRKCPQSAGGNRFSSLGQHLDAMLGGDLIVLGTAYGAGGTALEAKVDQSSTAALLGQVGRSSFALDLRALPPHGAARAWWSLPRPFLNTAMNQVWRTADCFDALIYIDMIRSAQRVETSP
ncbi:erythromycin esterase family protein [Sphingobium sp. WW5]|jgi:erythromycin esterase|uniref:erythromycin esterase family protein n=1 Tax=unclassified Sphingobium TaxID=2611147 RepID=UPI003C17E15B